GVGEASSAMRKLEQSGLDKVIPKLTQPVLGICLGMQLMCRHTEEGNTRGLGLFDVDVKKFNQGVKVPQIGWNQIRELKSGLFQDIPENGYIYLVHSYYAPLCEETIAVSDYGLAYSSALQRDNFYGVQFHPEKSSSVGAKILRNFIDM
ncbi:MAG: imidazole glycerol phosphate synthase subunit HisH, partial [Eudoraea sp.]|nr:imidazole glycerol phosphate synthase subunit HisH [Eudoraea sp.]